MNVLFFNFIAYLVWFLVVFFKERRLTVYSYLILFYCVVALLGYITVNNGIYYDTFGRENPNSLNITPYVFCFITFWMLFYPFRYIKSFNMRDINPYFIKKAKRPVFIWLCYIVPFTLLKLSEAFISIAFGLGDTYDLRHNEGGSLFNYENVLLEKFNGYGTFLLPATIPFIMIFAISGLKQKQISVRFSILLIVFCFLPSVLNGIAMGSRGALFMAISCILFFVFLYWSDITKDLFKKFVNLGLVFLLVVIIYSWQITSARVGDGGFDSILRYFGEPFPNLGFRFWEKVTYHPMGDRLFPNLFLESTSRYFDSVDESYSYWWMKTSVPVLNFKTFFGDLYIEFGVFYALFFTAILSLIVKYYFSVSKISYYNISFLYYYYQLCVFGFAGFTLGGHNGLFQLFIIFVIAVVLKFYFIKIR